MSSLDDFPADIRAAAAKAHGEYADSRVTDNLGVIIARAIQNDRKELATAILAKRYTEDQGIDAEMEAYNGGLEDAAKLLRGAS